MIFSDTIQTGLNITNSFTYQHVTANFNKSYTFCFPMLGAHKNDFKNVRACFIADEDKPQYNNHIFLLHKSLPDPQSIEYENKLMKHSGFVDVYYPDNYSVIFAFKVPEEFNDDYNIFLKSKYSHLSQKYKSHIIQFHGPYEKTLKEMLFYQVLTRDEGLRMELEESLRVHIPPSAELCSVLNMDIEVFHPYMKQA